MHALSYLKTYLGKCLSSCGCGLTVDMTETFLSQSSGAGEERHPLVDPHVGACYGGVLLAQGAEGLHVTIHRYLDE